MIKGILSGTHDNLKESLYNSFSEFERSDVKGVDIFLSSVRVVGV